MLTMVVKGVSVSVSVGKLRCLDSNKQKGTAEDGQAGG